MGDEDDAVRAMYHARNVGDIGHMPAYGGFHNPHWTDRPLATDLDMDAVQALIDRFRNLPNNPIERGPAPGALARAVGKWWRSVARTIGALHVHYAATRPPPSRRPSPYLSRPGPTVGRLRGRRRR